MSGSRHRELPAGAHGAWDRDHLLLAQPIAADRREPVHVGCQEGAMIDDRRLVGIDLGIASDHTVRVLDDRGNEVCRRRARPTVESLTATETPRWPAPRPGCGWRW